MGLRSISLTSTWGGLADRVPDGSSDVSRVKRLHPLRWKPLREVSFDESGLDVCHADAVGILTTELLAKRLREPVHGVLRRAVSAGPWERLSSRERGDVNDVPRALTLHERQGRLSDLHQSVQVHVDHSLELRHISLLDPIEHHHAGAVDQDIEAAEPIVYPFYRLSYVVFVGDISLNDEGSSALGLNTLLESLESVLPSGGQCHVNSLTSERLGRRSPDTRRGTGNECNLLSRLFGV